MIRVSHRNSASTFIAFVLSMLLFFCGIKPSLAEQINFTLPESIQTLQPNRHALINAPAKRQLDQAYHFVDQSNYDAALTEISELISKYEHNPVVVSHGLRLAAQILANQDKSETAILSLKKIIYLDSLASDTILDMKLLLAKLYLQHEKYNDSLPLLKAWIHGSSASEDLAQVYYLLAYTQYQLKHYDASIASAKKGLAEKPEDMTALLSIQLNSALELKEYPSAENVSVKLIQVQPNIKSYWINWVNTLRLQNKNKAALASIELMMQQHPLTENDTLNYIQLLLEQDFPERAARQLQEAIDSRKIKANNKLYYLLSQAWEKAGQPEKAILALEANQQQDKNSLTRLIYLHARSANWHSLIKLIDANQTLLKNEDWIWLHKARAYYETAQTDKATNLLEQLITKTNVDEKVKVTAEQWLVFYQGLQNAENEATK